MLIEQEIKCADRFPISIASYEVSEPKGLIIIGGAIGVSQKYYRNFANFLVEMGYQAITFDYRGTGKSLNKNGLSGISLEDWGAKDIEALIEFSKTKNVPIYFVGHSVGGQIIGLAPSSRILSKIVFIAASAPYWKRWRFPTKYKMLFASKILFPMISAVTTQFPTKSIGLGNLNVPSSAVKQWSDWMTSPDYLFDEKFGVDTTVYQELGPKILSIGFEDDNFAPENNINHFLGFFPNSEKTSIMIGSKHIGKQRIGHTGFFREKFKDNLWKDTINWIENDYFADTV